MLLLTCSARRHVAIVLPPSDASQASGSIADRVSLSSHMELNESTEDDTASADAVISADSKQLVMWVSSQLIRHLWYYFYSVFFVTNVHMCVFSCFCVLMLLVWCCWLETST